MRSQLSTNARNVSSSTARYYKRKGAQVLETVFEAIAAGQSKWLTQQVIEKYCHSTNSEVNTPEQTLLYLGSLFFTMRPQVGTQGNKSCRSLSATTLKQNY